MLPTTYTRKNAGWMPAIFNEFFNDDFMGITQARPTTPAVNVIEDEKAFTIEIAAPGMTKEDFKISLDNGSELTVALEKKDEKNEEKRNYLRREFTFASWQKTWIVPEEVEIENIAAAMTDGILRLNLPKKVVKETAPASRQIEIC